MGNIYAALHGVWSIPFCSPVLIGEILSGRACALIKYILIYVFVSTNQDCLIELQVEKRNPPKHQSTQKHLRVSTSITSRCCCTPFFLTSYRATLPKSETHRKNS